MALAFGANGVVTGETLRIADRLQGGAYRAARNMDVDVRRVGKLPAVTRPPVHVSVTSNRDGADNCARLENLDGGANDMIVTMRKLGPVHTKT